MNVKRVFMLFFNFLIFGIFGIVNVCKVEILLNFIRNYGKFVVLKI